MDATVRWGEKRYNSLDYYIKETFHEKLYKLSLNAGCTCPNRDGTCGTRGCIFCSRGGSGDFAADVSLSIPEQLRVEKEKKKSVSELYTKKIEKKKEKHVFKATPIISPVYGILDKNYKKEELKAKKESEYELKRPSKKVDFESVRMKAFGTLADELQDNLLDDLTDVKQTSNVEVYHDESLLDDIIEDSNKEDTTIGTAEENYYDFGVAYEVPKDKDVDSSDVKIVNHNDEEVVAEKIEVKEEKKGENKESSSTDDMELTDDLFNLIDSMYEEREDL